MMDDARRAQREVELYTLGVLGTPLETKEIKMVVNFKSVKPLRRIDEKLNQYHGEYCSRTSTNSTLHLYIREFGQKVTVNIQKGKAKTAQIQGLKNMDDMQMVMARFGQYGLRANGKPQLSSIICSTPMPLVHELNFPAKYVIGDRALKNGHARLYFKAGGAMSMTGRNWDDIKSWIDGFAGQVFAGQFFDWNEDPLFLPGPPGLHGGPMFFEAGDDW